jgi:metal-responsive CopG/Arc/MetJ family transcriptional regulator
MENEKRRLQFDFSVEALTRLDMLKDQAGLNTRAEAIRHALRLLEWTVEQRQEGSKILVQTGSGELREAVFPFLESERPAKPVSEVRDGQAGDMVVAR